MDVTVIVNTGDDIDVHGLRVCPDLDSVTYWLGDVADRERGWGRRGETFRTLEELRSFGPDGAWFALGDLDLATHLERTARLAEGSTLTEVTARIAARFGIAARIVPMSDDRVETRLDAVVDGGERDLHFQEYWVRRGAQDEVKAIRFQGVEAARPAPGVLASIGRRTPWSSVPRTRSCRPGRFSPCRGSRRGGGTPRWSASRRSSAAVPSRGWRIG